MKVKRVVAALLLTALLLSGCAPSARPSVDGQPPLAAIRCAVSAHGSRMPDGSYRLQQQRGALVFAVTAPQGRGVCFSLEMNAAGLCHTFTLVPGAPDACACAYTVTGGDRPLRLTGRIDMRAYPAPGSVTVDETADYAAARTRELFEQYTPLLLDTVQDMLAEYGAADAVHDLFPGFLSGNSMRI